MIVCYALNDVPATPNVGFPRSTSGKKNLPANVGDIKDKGSILGQKDPAGRGHGNQLQYSCLENPHGQRSLAGYSP